MSDAKNINIPEYEDEYGAGVFLSYLDTLTIIERIHRRFFDVIKSELERNEIFELNAVQALIIFSIGEKEKTATELKKWGFYQGLNVSHNLKKLIESNYVTNQKNLVDRRSIKMKLTEKGLRVYHFMHEILQQHAENISTEYWTGENKFKKIYNILEAIERFWVERMRSIC